MIVIVGLVLQDLLTCGVLKRSGVTPIKFTFAGGDPFLSATPLDSRQHASRCSLRRCALLKTLSTQDLNKEIIIRKPRKVGHSGLRYTLNRGSLFFQGAG